ncbi:UPF0103-domain-containing protein [Gautieria morchelliformis]|nr:UPF0103-domain-containing protein [Gautieria morchelliformis]
MSCRSATHAGSWYSSNRTKLDSELSNWLSSVNPSPEEGFSPPIKGCKAIIAPHAGYSYSGPPAAWAYKSVDPDGIKRVFILGPSHHVYMDGCALSTQTEYSTPIGNLPLDISTISQLRATGWFTDMSIETDEDEHSIEMHLPYIRKVFEGYNVSIVPILVGAIFKEKEVAFGQLLAPYLASEDTLCVVSSDFCHWGTRFQYTHYYESAAQVHSETHPVYRLSRLQTPPPSLSNFPIYASIEALDQEALRILTLPGASGSAAEAHENFAAYLRRTKNTICGRHPIGVLFGALGQLETSREEGEHSGKAAVVKWVKYAQSSKCFDISDSSVSYASAYVLF